MAGCIMVKKIFLYVALGLMIGFAQPADAGDEVAGSQYFSWNGGVKSKPVKNDLPKMVSLRWGETNIRKGPGKEFPVAFTLHAKGIPLKLTRRHGDWREIIDWQGSKGWVMRDSLSEQQAMIVSVDETDMLSKPAPSSTNTGRLVAKLKKGVTARIIKCEGQWCEVETFIGSHQGWVRKLDTKFNF